MWFHSQLHFMTDGVCAVQVVHYSVWANLLTLWQIRQEELAFFICLRCDLGLEEDLVSLQRRQVFCSSEASGLSCQ